MNAVPGTVEVVRVDSGPDRQARVLVSDDRGLLHNASEHPDSGLAERLYRLAVPLTSGGFTLRIAHQEPAPVVQVYDSRHDSRPGKWVRASSGVRMALLKWYGATLYAEREQNNRRAR